jgi:alcohol dehydrogenase class IV
MAVSASLPFSFQHGTRIVFGAGCWRGAVDDIAKHGPRALLVTGAHSADSLGVRALLCELLAERSIDVSHFSVPNEPDTILADRAGVAAREARATIVIGLGGGSPMDVAKVAAVLATNSGSSVNYLEGVPNGGQPILNAPLPVVCIPTTAGTGSEVTKNAVLQVAEFRFKRSVRSDQLFPISAFLDPQLSGAAPALVRAGSGFDALTHLVEAFCSRAANPLTDALARDGIRLAMQGLSSLARREAGTQAAEQLAIAACLGGMALANSGLGAAHGLISPLGGFYPNVPHGAGLACILPSTLRVNFAVSSRSGSATERLLETATLIAGIGSSMDRAADVLTELRQNLGLPSLSEYARAAGGIDVDAVTSAPSGSVKFNPVTLSRDELCEIMTRALSEN